MSKGKKTGQGQNHVSSALRYLELRGEILAAAKELES